MELMTIKLSENRHPVFGSMSPLSRGTLKSEFDFRTINSVIQFGTYGAVSELSEEYNM